MSLELTWGRRPRLPLTLPSSTPIFFAASAPAKKTLQHGAFQAQRALRGLLWQKDLRPSCLWLDKFAVPC